MLAMDAYTNSWLDLLARWLHVIAAIAWIGSSFYFIALDNHLRPPKEERDSEEGVGGEAWEVHGGGFYHVQKYKVAPRTLPEPLLWFKWEAYTTWLSGFALLIVLYYVNADTYLIDTRVADLSPWQAIAISIALLGAAWVVYDGLCRVLGGNELLLAAALLAFVAASAWGCGQLLSGRGAYIQVGAMVGTMMAGNVFVVIIPAHWELVRATQAGREPDAAAGLRGKQRSVHNNYLTLPVVFTMISNHFPFTYGHSHAWLVLVALMVIGAWVRHFFNLRHTGRTVWVIPVTAAIGIAGVAVAIRPKDHKASAGGASVAFAQVGPIVAQRCAVCHSAQPTYSGIDTAPKGVAFDSPAEIHAQAARIQQQAIDSTAMPLANVTKMTQPERDLLARWIAQGAKIP
jgi:uncharacterized membrane protein